MMKLRWHVLLTGVFLCMHLTLGLAQNRRESELFSAIDIAQFRADSTQTAVEFALSFPKARLPYDEIETNTFRTQLELNIAAYRGEKLMQKTAVRTSSTDSTVAREKGQLIVLARLTLPPENYRIVITLKSLGKKDFQAETARELEVKAFGMAQAAISDIRLGALAYRSTAKSSMFYRNGYEIVPNPTALFGSGFDTAILYAEFYNLNALPKDTKFFQRAFLTRNAQVLEHTERLLPCAPSRETALFLERIHIANLASGGYEFHLQLVDSAMSPILAQSKKIFVFNPHVKMHTPRVSAADESFVWMTEKDAQEMRSQIVPLITPDEAKAYDTLRTLAERQQFFQRFWGVRGGISARREFMNKVSEADKLYSTRFRRGYETDKGRIFLKYGRPTNVESVAGNQQSRPYEIWTYLNASEQIEMMFVFVDRSNVGNYELVHSTAPGEVQNVNWRTLIAMPNR
ncbi:MAG: GWxTD domain-containing protein [Candidatus Thermochlorobacter sp.]